MAVSEPGVRSHSHPRCLALCTQGQVSGPKEKSWLVLWSLSKSWKKTLQRLPTAAWEWGWFLPGTYPVSVTAVLVLGPELWTDFLTSCLMSCYELAWWSGILPHTVWWNWPLEWYHCFCQTCHRSWLTAPISPLSSSLLLLSDMKDQEAP